MKNFIFLIVAMPFSIAYAGVPLAAAPVASGTYTCTEVYVANDAGFLAASVQTALNSLACDTTKPYAFTRYGTPINTNPPDYGFACCVKK